MSTAKIFRKHFSPKKKIWLGGWPLWKIQTYQIYIANVHALDNSSKQFYPSEAPPPLLINTGSAHDIALNYTPGVVYLATKIKIESLTRAYQTEYSEFLELTIFYQNVCGSF